METALDEVVRSYLDLRWHIDPVEASEAGLSEHDERLGTYTADDVRRYLAALKSISGAIEEHNPESLDAEIDRTALLGDIRVTINRLEHERPHIQNPDFWISHLLQGLYVLLVARDRPREHLSNAAKSRLQGVPGFLDAARSTLGPCPPVFVETAVQVTTAGLALVHQLSERLAPADDPTFSEVVGSATEALSSFIDDLPGLANNGEAETSYAIGEKAFDFRLHFQHALRDNANELWRYGTALVREVEADLTQLAARIDGGCPWPDLIDRLRGDHPAADGLVDAYARAMGEARRFVEERGLAPIPDGDLDVLPTPAFLRPIIPFAAYQPPGAFSRDRRGWFYVTPPERKDDPEAAARALRDHCIYEIPSTALHEGYPGHHLHLVTAQNQPSVIRRVIGTPLTIEGWALYCEEMMGEEGFYSSLEEELFQRLALLWRAVRIVADIGLHTRGMSFDDAVQLLMDHVHFERGHAEAEVRRYCAEPAYQLCYAVGRRELRSLRDAYRRAAGADFSLRRFHEQILEYGALPVSLIRWGLGVGE